MWQQIILILLICMSGIQVYKIFISNDIALLFKIIILFSWFFWFFMPYVITPSDYDWFDNYLRYNDYVYYYILDAVYWNVAFYILLVLSKKRKLAPGKWLQFNGKFQENRGFNQFMMVFSIIVSLIYISNVLVSPMTYLENNDVENAGLRNPVVGYFSTICLAYIYYAIFYKLDTCNTLTKIILWVIVLMDVVAKLLHGSRIILILPVLIFLYYYLSTKKRIFAVIGLSITGLGLLLAPIISYQRTNEGASMSTSSVVLDGIVTELILKSNSVYYGASYLNNGGWGEGGFRVTKNSFLTNVPMPNKPVPISLDGTYETTFGRLAGNMRLSTYSQYINVGTAPSQHPIWVYGWFGYFTYMLLAGLLLWLLNYWFKSSYAFPVLFSLMFVSFPNCNILKSLDAILRDFPRYIIFYLFFYIIASLFYQNRYVRNRW